MNNLSAIILALGCSLLWTAPAPRAADAPYAGPPAADHHWLPPFVVQNAPLPNVLLILDNSNSMDEGPDGDPLGSAHPGSRSEIARRALRRIIAEHGESMRIGLMSFRQGDDLRPAHLYSMLVYASYDPRTYDPLASPTPRQPGTNTRRAHNASFAGEQAPYDDDDHYVYFDTAMAAYLPAQFTDLFCYSTGFLPRGSDPTPSADAGCSANWYDTHLCSDGPYRCHPAKTGESDLTPDGLYTTAGDQDALEEHIGEPVVPLFSLSDGGLARGFYQLGAQAVLRPVGEAWVSDTSPGGGEVVVEIADPDAAHHAELLARIARVERYEVPYDMDRTDPQPLPVRNAGLSPLSSALDSARRYFAGTLESGTGGMALTSPIHHACQSNYIVLVTDGLSTEIPPGGGDPLAAAADAAAALRRTEVPLEDEVLSFDIRTFVLGVAPLQEAAAALDALAVAGGTDVGGRAYRADEEMQLEAALGRLLRVITRQSLSGSAVSVVTDARTGQGALYQAVFYPYLSDGSRSVHWAGDVRGLFVDAAGLMRESTPEGDGSGDQVLEDSGSPSEAGGDPIITMCYDDTLAVTRVHKAARPSSIPTAQQAAACDPAVFTDTPDDIEWLWSGGEWLAELGDPASQRVYEQASPRRYIFTGIDGAGGDGLVGAEEERPFLAASFGPETMGLLQAGDAAAVQRIVAYIRGADQPGMRSRRVDYDRDGVVETWRLGDVVYATPVVVDRPAENFDLLYRDAGYREFARRYRDRRRVVYVGANDGMLHAFNGGFYDSDLSAFRRGHPPHALGAELWAYVPYNLLPHLRYLTVPSYSSRGGEHICFVDLQPVVFDARIFGDGGVAGQPGAEHPAGWGTLLVGGMRFGGREMRVEAAPGSPGSDVRTLRSAYFILDVTDPEKPPKLLLEFTHPNLGYTTSRPTPLKVGDDWYLMLGSGPYPANAETLASAGSSQPGRLMLVDLKRMALDEDFGEGGVLGLDLPDSFISDLVAVDFDLADGADSTEAVYFGTVSGSPEGGWSGSLQRVRIAAEGVPPVPVPPAQWDPSLLLETAKPMACAVNVGLDGFGNRWVFAGSGRYLTAVDGGDTSRQRFFAVKEPRTTGDDLPRSFSWGAVDPGELKDVTPVAVAAGDFLGRAVFEALRADIDEHHAGWYLELEDEGERCVGQAALLGDILGFTTFVPNQEMCADGGSSNYYAVYFTTGSAYYEPVLGTGAPADGGPGDTDIARKLPLGRGLSAVPSLHAGKDSTLKVFLHAGGGTIVAIDQHSPGVLRSGPIHWELW